MSEDIHEDSYTGCNANPIFVTPREDELKREFRELLAEESRRDVDPSEVNVRAEMKQVRLNGDIDTTMDVIKVANGDIRDPDILYYEVLGEQEESYGLTEAGEELAEYLEQEFEPSYGVEIAKNPEDYINV